MKYAPQAIRDLSLEDDVVRLHTAGKLFWELPLSEMRVIGEYTTDAGPWADDYVVLFVGEAGNWFEAPIEAVNLESVLGKLSDRLKSPITLGLANSTSLRSRILWPPSLRGQELLSFRPATRRNWLLRIFVRRVEYSLTQVVLDAVGST